MQELVRMRQQHQTNEAHLHALSQSLHRMERRQQQMVSFLAQAVHNPDILTELVQQNNVDNHIPRCNKRKFPNRGELDGESASSGGQIVMHQPTKKPESFTQLKKVNFATDSLCSRTIPSTQGSEIFSQDIPRSEIPSQDIPRSTQIPHGQSTIMIGAGKDLPPVGIGIQDFAPAHGAMTNESISAFPSSYPLTDVEVPLFSPLGVIDEMIPVELEKFSGMAGIDICEEGEEMKLRGGVDSFWGEFLSVGAEKVDSSIAKANCIPEMQQNAWNTTENMQNLTMQIGFLMPTT